jgi:hypothetical protein
MTTTRPPAAADERLYKIHQNAGQSRRLTPGDFSTETGDGIVCYPRRLPQLGRRSLPAKPTSAANRKPTATVRAPQADNTLPAALLAQLPGYPRHNGGAPIVPVATAASVLDGFLTATQLCQLLGIHERTLARWREHGRAPPRIRLPGRQEDPYSVASVVAWMRSLEETAPAPPRKPMWPQCPTTVSQAAVIGAGTQSQSRNSAMPRTLSSQCPQWRSAMGRSIEEPQRRDRRRPAYAAPR